MCNAHTILHYSQIPQYFACSPLTLQEYFTGGPIEDPDMDTWCMDSVWEECEVLDDEDIEMENTMDDKMDEETDKEWACYRMKLI